MLKTRKKIKNEVDIAIQNLICIKNPKDIGYDSDNDKKLNNRLTKTLNMSKNLSQSPMQQKRILKTEKEI